MPEPASSVESLPSVCVTGTDQGCLLEITGRMTRQLLDHARDLVYAQTKPATCLTVRVADAVPTGELVAMLIAVRRHLARSGSTVYVDDPQQLLPLRSDADGRLTPIRR